MDRERRGDYLGKTVQVRRTFFFFFFDKSEKEKREQQLNLFLFPVFFSLQVVPHVTDAVQDWIERVASVPVDGKPGRPDVCVIELVRKEREREREREKMRERARENDEERQQQEQLTLSLFSPSLSFPPLSSRSLCLLSLSLSPSLPLPLPPSLSLPLSLSRSPQITATNKKTRALSPSVDRREGPSATSRARPL